MRILIADDHPIFRAGVKEALAKETDVDFVGEADDGRKTLALARKHRWDLVLLDITMPGRDGLEVLRELGRERPKLPVLVLSAHPEHQLALRLLRAGAAGYLTRDKAPEVLLTQHSVLDEPPLIAGCCSRTGQKLDRRFTVKA